MFETGVGEFTDDQVGRAREVIFGLGVDATAVEICEAVQAALGVRFDLMGSPKYSEVVGSLKGRITRLFGEDWNSAGVEELEVVAK